MVQSKSRQIRVFISSTFKDMQGERDYLVKFIFPQLRKLCESRGVTWGEVDLRWGITEEQSAEGQVLPICLAEIERSRPYFIGMLGERYGWIPDTIDPELVEQEPWLAEHKNHSVTELEILHGVLNDPEMADHALFYFRDPEYIRKIDESQQEDFIEVPWRSDIEQYGMAVAKHRVGKRKAKLARLKDRIRSSGLPLKENYRNPEQLGEWVLADLTEIINQLYPEGEQPDPLAQEAMLHEAFAQSRARVYIGGEKYFAQLDAHDRVSNQPLVLTGESGSGKSALLANWGLQYQEEHPNELMLMHFIGASADSTDLSRMLRRLMAELKKRFEIPEEIPETEDKLRSAFPNWLFIASAKGKAVLILDGLNQLDNRNNAKELDWLPLELPENVRVLLSTLPGRAMDVIKERNWPTLTIEPLGLKDREQLVGEFLALYSKQLSDENVARIAQDPQSDNPLGLRLLLDELRQFGVYGKELDAVIDRYLEADSISEMVGMMLERLEHDFETERPKLVHDAMRHLWAARRGLSEVELLDLLGEEGLPLPHRIWSPLSLALENSLVDRGGLLGFSHDYVRQAVEERYLGNEKEKRKAHTTLADYFENFEGTLTRKLDELPWQLAEARAWELLYGLLANLDFFETLYEHSKTDLLTYWAAVEANSDLNRVEAYQVVVNNPEGVGLHMLNWLSLMYMDSGYLEEAMVLHKEQERICRQLRNLDTLSISLGNQANILYTWGKLKEAMALHKEEERIWRQLGNLDHLSSSLGNQAKILYDWGKLEEAMALVKEAERICRQLGNLDHLSSSLGSQALILDGWGKPEEAMAQYKEQERICRQLGNLDVLVKSLGNQAMIMRNWGKLEEAMALNKEQERISRQMGNLDGLQASLGNKAAILLDWGKLEEAMALLKEEERICRQLGNLDYLSRSLGTQALILDRWGKPEEAMAQYKEQERIWRHLGNLNFLSASLANQAMILRRWGKVEEAMALLNESEHICRQLGNLDQLSRSLGIKAMILQDLSKLEEAMALLKEVERICRQLGNLNTLSSSLSNQANILHNWGKLEEAILLYKEEEIICRQLGNLNTLSMCLGNQALILDSWGKLKEAMALFKEQERICRQLRNLDTLSGSLGNQANIFYSCGKLKEAMALLKEVERICRQTGNLNTLSISLSSQANILYKWGKLEKAMALYKEGERICRQLGNIQDLSGILANLGMIHVKKGDQKTGLKYLNEALALANNHGYSTLAKWIEGIYSRLM
jgi:tetratricopeptide (TPR) repeat protein